MMATPFADYYKKALANYAPAREQAVAAADASMADRGLYNSTGAVGKVAQIGQQYDAQARAAAEQSKQFDMNAMNQERQTYLQWFDAVNNLALAKKQMGGYKPAQIQYQKRPAWLDSYFSNRALGSQQIGDGKGKVVAGEKLGKSNFADTGGKTNQQVSMSNAQKNAEASLSLERQRLAQAIKQYKDSQAKKDDPYAKLTEYAVGLQDSDPTLAAAKVALQTATAKGDAEGVAAAQKMITDANTAIGNRVASVAKSYFGLDLKSVAGVDPQAQGLLGLSFGSDTAPGRAAYLGTPYSPSFLGIENGATPAAPSHALISPLQQATEAVGPVVPSASLFGDASVSSPSPIGAYANTNPLGWMAAYNKKILDPAWKWLNTPR